MTNIRALAPNYIPRVVNPNAPKSCVLKIGNIRINLNDIIARSRTLTINGQTCEVSFKDRILVVNTQAAIDINIAGHVPADAIYISTQGKARIYSYGETLEPRHGIFIDAKQVVLKAPVKGPGIIKIDTHGANAVSIYEPIDVLAADINTAKLVTTAPITVSKFSVQGYELQQGAKSKFVIGEPRAVPATDLNAQDPIQQQFLQARAQLLAQERSRIDMQYAALQADINGANLDLIVSERLDVWHKIIVNNLGIKSKFLFSHMFSVIDGLEYLELHGDRAVILGDISAEQTRVLYHHIITLFTGRLCGFKKLIFNSYTGVIALGGRWVGMEVEPRIGWYLNFLGWLRTFHFILDAMSFSFDLGLTTPYIPVNIDLKKRTISINWNELKAAINKQKALVAVRAIAGYIYKPAAILLRAILKMMTIERNLKKYIKALEVEHAPAATNTNKAEKSYVTVAKNLLYIVSAFVEYLNKPFAFILSHIPDPDPTPKLAGLDEPDPTLEKMNAMIAVKNILFAASAIKDLANIPEEMQKTAVHVPVSCKSAIENNTVPILHRFLIIAMPSYVVDSVVSVRAGVSVTGAEVETQASLNKKHNHSVTLTP